MESDDKQEQSTDQADGSLLEQAEALIWRLLDDEISPADLKRLEDWLRANSSIRELYVQCVQMHIDLYDHFRTSESSQQGQRLPASPVLGLLGDLRAAGDSRPPVSD